MCLVSRTNALVVKKHKVYTCDLTDPGFQHERLVTGKRMSGRHDTGYIERLHLMKMGHFEVVFSVEVNAVDSDRAAVEIKASNAKNWETKTMLQMFSSVSAKLCHGTIIKDQLERVEVKSLSNIAL